jgi:fatty-acyl-CoA synthase
MRALERTASIERNPHLTLPVLIGQLADQHEAAPALRGHDASFTYRQLASRCNQYARWGAAQGLGAGDVVCQLMPNCVEYPALWLGLTRIGVRVALLNSHLTGELLAHSIRIVAPKLIIVDACSAPALGAARAGLPKGLPCWVRGQCCEDMQPIEPQLRLQDEAPLPLPDRSAPLLDATALFIYTSGTTGLPKAAMVSHYRLMQWSHWFAGLMDVQPQDRMYNCLPLYHSVGGIVATGATLVGGGAVVIRGRFSAANFWRDVHGEGCTLFQYIGELCRYLVNAPRQAADTAHSLRLACGNGLRPEVWGAFKARFRIPRIIEYYAATEGNFSLYNCEEEPGAIGRIPPFLAHRLPVALLRLDVESGEPRRDAAGICEQCAPDEVGEAVGRIPAAQPARAGRFEGYADPEATARKVLRDVFEKGDAWYRTGDLMRRDARGFYYFVDRAGDTFRWKGENVSSAEVLSTLSTAPGVLDGVVYGVPVPGTDGRAGMAALIVGPDFDLAALREHLTRRLPGYARPLFLRLLPRLESTATFKPIKRELARAGFDPAQVSDPLFFDSRARQAFVPLDQALYAAITAGAERI